MTNDDDDKNNFTVAKEENNTAAASDNDANSNNEAISKTATATSDNEASATAESENSATANKTAVAKKEETNSLDQSRQAAIQEVEKAWKNANLNSSEADILGKDWKKEFENKDQAAIDKYKQELMKKIVTKWLEEGKKEAQSSQQPSSSSGENKQSKFN